MPSMSAAVFRCYFEAFENDHPLSGKVFYIGDLSRPGIQMSHISRVDFCLGREQIDTRSGPVDLEYPAYLLINLVRN